MPGCNWLERKMALICFVSLVTVKLSMLADYGLVLMSKAWAMTRSCQGKEKVPLLAKTHRPYNGDIMWWLMHKWSLTFLGTENEILRNQRKGKWELCVKECSCVTLFICSLNDFSGFIREYQNFGNTFLMVV